MLDIISKLKMLSSKIREFKATDKSKLMIVCVNICCIFTIIIIVMLLKFSIHILPYNLLEFTLSSLLEVLIVALEILLCTQVGSYAFNKSESIRLHIPYALIASLVLNILLELYKMQKLIDVKRSIASFSITTNTLTTINIEIVLLVAIIIGEIILGIYIYNKYFLVCTKEVLNEEKR